MEWAWPGEEDDNDNPLTPNRLNFNLNFNFLCGNSQRLKLEKDEGLFITSFFVLSSSSNIITTTYVNSFEIEVITTTT